MASVWAYNSAYRGIYMEVQNIMNDADALFMYIIGLKESI